MISRTNPSTRDRILEEARDIYLESGMAGFSMRKVAARTGVTATAIYRHFDNKEALLVAVASAGFQLFGRYLFRGLEGKTSWDRLHLAGEGYLRFGLEHCGYYRVMFMSSAEDFGFDKMPADAAIRLAPTFQFLVDRVRECIEDHTFAPADPVEVAATIWSSVHGAMSLYLTGKLRPVIQTEDQFIDYYRASQLRLRDGLSA